VATLQRDRIGTARLAYFGCSDRAKLARAVSAAVAGLAMPLADASAFEQAIHKDLTPDDTPGLRGDTKLHMASVLTRRVLNSLSEQLAA
jgi:CO/xanthine dehydrogenase FAD-binding subunit